MLASCSADKTIRLWRTNENNEWQNQFILKGHNDPVKCIAFMEEAGVLLSGGFDMYIKVWSLSTYDCLRSLQ